MLSLRRGDDYLVIEPDPPVELERKLSFFHRTITVNPDKPYAGKQITGVTVPMFRRVDNLMYEDGTLGSQLTTYAGLYQRVVSFLEEQDIPYELSDERTPLPEIDVDAIGRLMACADSSLRASQYDGLMCAIDAGMGRIQAPTGWGKTRLMAALAASVSRKTWMRRDTPTTVIVSPGADVLHKNAAELQLLLPWRRVCVVDGGCPKSDDIIVTTPESMHYVDPDTIGMIQYDEAHTLSLARATTLLKARRAMRYGFSASCEGRFDGGDMVSEAVLGPIIYNRTYAEAVAEGAIVPIEVWWLEAPCPEDEAQWQLGGRSREASYRYGLWRNQELHKLLGGVWRELPADAQALMIAQSLEHVSSLLPHLTTDTVQVHGQVGAVKEGRYKSRYANIQPVSAKERKRIYHGIANNEIKRVISTGIYRQGVSFNNVAAVVNVSGMGSKIIAQQLPGRACRNAKNKDIGVLIDLWFPWDLEPYTNKKTGVESLRPGHLQRDSLSRQKVYASLGFEQVHLSQ